MTWAQGPKQEMVWHVEKLYMPPTEKYELGLMSGPKTKG